MVGHLLRLDLSVLDVDLVTTQYNGYSVTDVHQVTMPYRNVVVRHSCCHVKHDDGTLCLDVVAISQTSELFLTGSVPHVELDGSSGSVEDYWMHFDSNGSCGWVGGIGEEEVVDINYSRYV